MTNTSNFINIRIHILSNATLPQREGDTTDDELQKDPLKHLSTTILCMNHILTFPFDRNLQPIQSVNIPDDIIPQ